MTAKIQKATEMQNQATAVQDQATAVQDQATAVQDQATKMQDQATAVQDQTTAVQDQAMTMQGQIITVQDQAVVIQDQATAMQDQATAMQDQATAMQDQATAMQDQAQAPATQPTPIRPILFVLGLVRDWGLYTPALLRLARKHTAGIHVLETGAPAGTGTFTASTINNTPAALVGKPSSVFDDPHPSESLPDDQVSASDSTDPKNLNLAWPDVVASTAQMNSFVSALVEYFRAAGFIAAGEWLPDFDHSKLAAYAHSIGAQVIAIPQGGFLSSLFQGFQASDLEQQGFEVIWLEEISQTDLDKLKAGNDPITEQQPVEGESSRADPLPSASPDRATAVTATSQQQVKHQQQSIESAVLRASDALDGAIEGRVPEGALIGLTVGRPVLHAGVILLQAGAIISQASLEQVRLAGAMDELLAVIENPALGKA
jgi:hypothetical protein